MQTEKLLFKLECCPTQLWHHGWSGRACLHAQGRLEAGQTSSAQICLLPKSHLVNHGRASSRPCPRALSGCQGYHGHLVRQWQAFSFWRGGWKWGLCSKIFLSPLLSTGDCAADTSAPRQTTQSVSGMNQAVPCPVGKNAAMEQAGTRSLGKTHSTSYLLSTKHPQ